MGDGHTLRIGTEGINGYDTPVCFQIDRAGLISSLAAPGTSISRAITTSANPWYVSP
jgi:hypothetical protein